MREAEQRALPYLFRIRLTANVRRAIERAVNGPRSDAGRGWQGQSIQLRLDGWGRQRRVVLLRRKPEGPLAISEQDANGQQRLSFATVDARKQVWNTVLWSLRRMLKSSIWVRRIVTVPIARMTSTNARTNGGGPGSPRRTEIVAS